MRGRRHFSHSAQDVEEPTINLTPLIDVVFVVLIMFILVAPLLELDRINLADAASSDEVTNISDQSLVTIHVRQDNSILLNNSETTLERLAPTLADLRTHFPTARPQVFHDKDATFGTYQAVKNAVEGAGFPEMDIILKPT